MTPKERMLTALRRGTPDRLPATIHQWQGYHLKHFMGGVDQLEAYRATGLDASVALAGFEYRQCPGWEYSVVKEWDEDGHHFRGHRIRTPEGDLTYTTAHNDYTGFVTEYACKTPADAEMFLKHCPRAYLNHKHVSDWYDRTADSGIVRGFVWMNGQPGVWQEFCELFGTQEAIYLALDNPQFAHWALEQFTQRKVDYVHREMKGAKFDLIEHGGGTASCTVISPAMFEEFCVPYDKRIITALHEEGFLVVYHTCGGMMSILENIPHNGADASETLSPVGVGGDIKDRADRVRLKQVLGSKVALIGGIDQGAILTDGNPADVRSAVRECFETFGAGGGYICSASDHFFHAPVENLKAMADAARECVY